MRLLPRHPFLGVLLLLAHYAFGLGCGSSSSTPEVGGDAGTERAVVDGGDAQTSVAAPDLRFKWIASGFTLRLSGITNGGTGGPGVLTAEGPIGATPLDLTGEGSSDFATFSTSVNLEPMVVIATTGSLSSLEDDLTGFLTAHSIVVSLDSTPIPRAPSEAPGGAYNAIVTGTQGGTVSYLPYSRGSTAAPDFPAWVSTEGSRGRVVTALCPKDGLLFATAFGRTGDTMTYETQVVTTALDGLETELMSLASGGYFITALGRDGTGSDGAGGFVIVGTRRAGETTARSVKIIDVPCITGGGGTPPAARELFDEGYAMVGEIFHNAGDCNGAPTWAIIGER